MFCLHDRMMCHGLGLLQQQQVMRMVAAAKMGWSMHNKPARSCTRAASRHNSFALFPCVALQERQQLLQLEVTDLQRQVRRCGRSLGISAVANWHQSTRRTTHFLYTFPGHQNLSSLQTCTVILHTS